ncbi:hypothetical protein Tco_1089547, partial [Tanacetum coccineum]
YDFATGKVPPKKARKYKKVASPSIKLSPVKEAEPVKKGKRVKRPAKKSTTAPTASVVIRVTPGVCVSKKKAPVKADRSKDEGTDDNDDLNDDDDDDDSKGNDDKADIDDDGNSDADDNERTDSDDDDKNPSFTLKDYDEEEHNEEYESADDNENVFEEEDDDDLYKDVDVRSLGTEHEKERKAPPSNHEVASLMNIKMSHEVPSTQIPSPLTEPATVIPDSSNIASTTVPPTISMISPLP